MESRQVYLITGASTGFGALAARALAREGHVVYAGMYAHGGDTSQSEDEVRHFNKSHGTDIRTVPLDLLSQASVDEAVKTILAQAQKLDVLVHNAGHMNYGPAESFTAEQYLRLYDVNVVGAQRLSMAMLPHFRSRREGHMIWISSSSVYGGKSPWLGGYFAAKAAFDSLAQTYARELNPWGIETTVVNPGVFTSGTSHFLDAMRPGIPSVAAEYDATGSPTEGVSEQNMRGTASVVPEGAEPDMVAEALVQISRAPRGSKSYRVTGPTVDPARDGSQEVAAAVDRSGERFYQRIGLEKMLHVRL